jgi:hypothetical protein
MNLEELITTAELLKQPSESATNEFYSHIDSMAEELNKIMGSRPDIDKLIGPDNSLMMENNSRNLLRFMGSVFYHTDGRVLAETAVWAVRAYRSHGFQVPYWPANLDTMIRILQRTLSESAFHEVYPFFEWLVVHLPALTELSEPEP